MKSHRASEFFDTSGFSVPSDGDALNERVQTNVGYYQANYMLLVVVFLVYVCLARPVFAVALAASVAAGYYVFMVQQGALVVGGTVLTRQRLAAAWLAASVLLLLLAGGLTFLWVLLVSILFILVHSVFRKRSMKARTTTFVAGTTPLGAAFKSLDDALHGSDDEETVGGAGSADMEGAYGVGARSGAAPHQQQHFQQQQQQYQQPQQAYGGGGGGGAPGGYPQAGAAPAYPSYPSTTAGAGAPYRNDFRAQMRAKYQKRPQ